MSPLSLVKLIPPTSSLSLDSISRSAISDSLLDISLYIISLLAAGVANGTGAVLSISSVSSCVELQPDTARPVINTAATMIFSKNVSTMHRSA